MRKRSFYFLLIALVTISSRAAAAPPVAPKPPEPVVAATEEPAAVRAAKLRDQGNDAMLAMRYADALASYSSALALTPDDAGLSYSIARAHQFLGDYPEALAALETFDQKATPEMRAKVPGLAALYAEIKPRVAILNLACDQQGARVLVRDRVIGSTPLSRVRLLAGAATVRVELDGYFVESRDVSLPGGGELALAIQLHPKSSSGFVSITTVPMGALVSVDGRELGTSTPKLELALPAGPHEVRVAREGYEAARVPIVLAPGAARDVSIPLEATRAIYTRWWFWAGVGAVVVGGVALTYALTTERSAGHGTLTPSQVSGP